jgi:magnesium transporter
MITRHARGKVVWVDMECPTAEELQTVMAEFDIDPRIEEEIVSPTPYPIVVTFPKYLYMILHFPTTEITGGAKNQEIDFIVGKHFLITARYEVIESIHNLQRVFEAEELIGLPSKEATTSELLERVMRRLYGAIRQEVEHIAGNLERIERDIFAHKEKIAVRRISEANRVLLRFDTTLNRHAESLEIFLTELQATAFFGKAFAANAAHIGAHRDHVAALVSSYKAVASELRQTNDSLLNTSQNEVMKTLTILTFITFPPVLLAGVFGMNIDSAHLPIVEHPMAFVLILLLMLFCSSLVYLFFKLKNWL